MLDPAGKADLIAAYGRRFCLDTLVETGTYHGDTVAACLPSFTRVFSVELGPELARECAERFKGYGGVTIACGDSGRILPCFLAILQDPCLIWLDAHYSGGDTVKGEGVTPVIRELQAISTFARPGTVVLIDDARDFVPEKGHPPLDGLVWEIADTFEGYEVEVVDDIIRITPKKGI